MKTTMDSLQSKTLLAVTVGPSAGRGVDMRIVRFPAEFEKSFWKGLDRRIVGIFVINLVVIYGFLIMAASRPKSAVSGQLDARLLTRLTNVLRVDSKLLEDAVVSEQSTESIPSRKVTPSRIANHGTRSSIETARKAAESRFRRASENASQRGFLAVVGVDQGTDDKYGGFDFSARPLTLDHGRIDLRYVAEVQDKRHIDVSANHAGQVKNIADLVSINGGEAVVSVRASESGRELVGLGKTSFGGTILEMSSASAIQSIVDQNAAAIVSCYQKELKRHPDLKGRLSVQIRINPAGLVKGVTVVQNTVNADMAACIQNKIRGWRFPSGRKNMVTVNQSFVFSK